MTKTERDGLRGKALHWLGHHGFPSLIHGHVVSSTDTAGNVWIGYECGVCGEVRGSHIFDAAKHIDAAIQQEADHG